MLPPKMQTGARIPLDADVTIATRTDGDAPRILEPLPVGAPGGASRFVKGPALLSARPRL